MMENALCTKHRFAIRSRETVKTKTILSQKQKLVGLGQNVGAVKNYLPTQISNGQMSK